MTNKITIIGAGSVGSTIAYTLAVNGIASEVVLIDVNTQKALGEAMDIRQATPFAAQTQVYAGSYSDAEGSNVVIVTSGIARKPGQSRIDLTQTNVNIIKSIAPDIVRHAPDAIYILVSNPVDILTYVFGKVSGLPTNRVIGSGTILDTARLRTRLAEYFSISQKNIHAYVLGEHGDSSFIPWSMASISSISLEDYRKSLVGDDDVLPELDVEEVEKYVRTSGGKIIGRKGATYYGIAASVCHICRCLFSSTDTILTVSSTMTGEYGLNNVALSVMSVVGSEGIKGNICAKLTDEEMVKLNHSADVLKDVIRQISI